MNELRFLDFIGSIDDDLIREAELPVNTVQPLRRRRITLIASIAAAAFLLLALPMLHKHSAKDMLDTHSQQQNSGEPSPEDAVAPVSQETTSEPTDSEAVETAVSPSAEEKPLDDMTPVSATQQNTAVSAAERAGDQSPTAAAKTSPSGNGTALPSTGRARTAASQQTHTQTRTTVIPKTEPATTVSSSGGSKGGVDITGCFWSPFRGTKDPDTDSFGDDEIHHVDIRTEDGFYRQLSPDEYSRHGIAGEVGLSDFGDYIAKVVEVGNNSEYHGGGAETQEPALAGADVYRYAASGSNKAYIIVKKGTQCSIFMSDVISTSQGIRNGLEFFGVRSAEDIQSIEYSISVPQDGRFVVSVQDALTDPARISAVFDILCSLEPEDYTQLPDHTGTPQWLVDAWESYRNDPCAPQRTDYDIMLKLRDGTEPVAMRFQPYLGNGYVEGMKELTPEQNQALRDLLS